MRAFTDIVTSVLAASWAATAMAAQQARLPVRDLGPVVAQVRDSLQSIVGVHVFRDGRVLVNDRSAKRMVIYDSNLTRAERVVDVAYPMTGGKLFGYLADTTLFLDPNERTLAVIGPSGAIARTIPLPTPGIQGATTPATSWSAGGQIVYEAPIRRAAPVPSLDLGSVRVDSILLLDVDIATSRIDTVTRLLRGSGAQVFFGPGGNTLMISGTSVVTITSDSVSSCIASAGAVPTCLISLGTISVRAAGGAGATTTGQGGAGRGGGEGAGSGLGRDTAIFTKSLSIVAAEAGLRLDPALDAWTVLQDGAVAVVRGADSRIDLYRGGVASTVSLPEPFVSPYLTPDKRVAFVDSLERYYAAHPEPSATPEAVPPGMKVVFGAPEFPDPASLPSHTATFSGAKADADGHLWIQEIANPSVWSVVTATGQLIDRIRIPTGSTIESFGPGVVYLVVRAGNGMTLAKARIH